MQRVECPNCETSYTVQRMGIKPYMGQIYTVICSVCEQHYDLTYSKRWWRKSLIPKTALR